MQEEQHSYLFTSESVTEGHPDKICDQISDAILDAILAKETELAAEGYVAPGGIPADPKEVRCAVETMATTGLIMVTGEVRTQAYADVRALPAKCCAKSATIAPSTASTAIRAVC